MSLYKRKICSIHKKGKAYQKAIRFLKKDMNHYIRRCSKVIADDDIGCKTARKPYQGYFD